MTTPAEALALRPIALDGLPHRQLTAWLQMMLRIRAFEVAADRLALRGKVPGGVHVAVGQEAVAVGVVMALNERDIIAGGHRSHHHALAKGLPADRVMAELFGKRTGVVGGRGGTMHLADFARGYFGGNGIVGAGLGIAMGAALGAQIRGEPQVTVGFVGDGGANTGRVWEAVNLAAIWSLPHIIVCENNLYAVETHVDSVTAGAGIAARAAGFGVATEIVDGQDVGAVHRAAHAARARALAGDGPTFIEAQTYRYYGHNAGETQNYREADEVERWRLTLDPIARLAGALLREGLLSQEEFNRAAKEADEEIERAEAFAEDSEWPPHGDLVRGVYSVKT